MTKPYSEVSIAIDLVIDAFKLTDPFEIQQKIEETLDMEIHINSILDYMELQPEDYEYADRMVEHQVMNFDW